MTEPESNHSFKANQTLGEMLSLQASRQMKISLGFDLQKLGEMSNKVAFNLEGFGKYFQVPVKWSDSFSNLFSSHQRERVGKYVWAVIKWSQAVDALNEAGWLPYHSVPLRDIAEYEATIPRLDSYLSWYYRTHWNEIRDDMESHLVDCCQIDDEARAVFREALNAHESGLYRCVCRTLFPEIERVIGAGLRWKALREKLIGTRGLRHFYFEALDHVTFGQLINHVYKSGGLENFKKNSIPNRHAAIHGLVSYSTHKHSMNMLILTDYVFRILPQENKSEA